MSNNPKERKFAEAKEVVIKGVNDDGSDIDFSRFKGLVNAENVGQIFNVVGKDYKVAQHRTVVDTVTGAVDDLKLKVEADVAEISDGARIQVQMVFPEIQLDMGTDGMINMRMTFDNSYDSTTGLRLEVGAFRQLTRCIFFVGEKFSSYYHRHTKGLSIPDLEDTISKGVETFQTRIKAEFEMLAKTSLPDLLAVKAFLKQCIEDKTISVKYLEKMVDTVDNAKPTTLWKLYNMVCEVLSNEGLSVDRHRTLTNAMLKAMKSTFIKL